MYRILTINRVAIENCRLAVYGHKKHVVGLKDFGSGGGIVGRQVANAFLLQPARYQIINKEHQKAVYCHIQQNIQNLQLSKSKVIHGPGVVENCKATTSGGEYILHTYIFRNIFINYDVSFTLYVN